MARLNPTWQRDELILALDLYFRHSPLHISKEHPEIVALSRLLNKLPIHCERPDEDRFRNPNGVYMKLCNFLRFDPEYKGKGLRRGGSLERAIWDEFAGDRKHLAILAREIGAGHKTFSVAGFTASQEPDEEEFPEGRILYRRHRARERNRQLVKKAKEKALRLHGRLFCAACQFDFASTYGKVGEGYIECHHTLPLSELSRRRTTRMEEIVLLCSNCHRMVHRKRPWLTVKQVTSLAASSHGELSTSDPGSSDSPTDGRPSK
jgi:5-methylcytosine-specific restriction protein A